MSPAAIHVNEMTISVDLPLLKAIEAMSAASDKILLVNGEDGALVGVLTDYDIRQAILQYADLSIPVAKAINRTPIVAHISDSDHKILNIMRNQSCAYLPVVDGQGRAVRMRFIREFAQFADPRQSRLAVVMAGGFGRRLFPLTEETPKPLLVVAGRPVLFILLDQILNDGFDRVILTLHYRADDIIKAVRKVSRYRDRVQFVVEEEPLGTAGALSILPERPSNSFLLINADLLNEVPLSQMLAHHEREQNAVTVATRLESYQVPFGVCEIEDSKIVSIREKPIQKMFVNTGVYVISPDVLNCAKGGRMDMPELLTRLLDEKRPVGSFPIHEYWLDMGTHSNYLKAQEDFGSRGTGPGEKATP